MKGGLYNMEKPDLSALGDIPIDSITEVIADKYNGTKVKVKNVFTDIQKTSWKNNVKLPEGEYVEVPVVVVETEVFGTDAKEQPLAIKEKFSLKQVGNKVGISEHPKSKARKLLKMLKINRVEEAIGREVLIVKSVDDNNRVKLVISLPQ